MNKNSSISKLFNWEHWPSFMFYVPNLPYAFYLGAKARNLVFFSIVNPAIKSSGNGTESKFKTIQLAPEKHRPKSVLSTENKNFKTLLKELKDEKISFPLIAKPDIGFRGLLVKKINSEKELKDYLNKYPIKIIIQEFLDYENECGVFYHRKPNEKTGNISSLTLKHFLTVTGDGKTSLKNLILNDDRAKLYINLFSEIHKEKLITIPKEGEIIKLTAIGNHSKGTQFINGNHLISEELTKTFDELSHKIEGWYYGRIDIKYNAFENLENGTDFKILEINGIIAEPTHIYDSKNFTYYKALKEIRKHWKFLYQISKINHTDFKISYQTISAFLKEVKYLKRYTRTIQKLSSK